MTFRETLQRHVRATCTRDLAEVIETIPADALDLITADGRLVRSAAEFVQMHAAWFAQSTWSLDATVVSVIESPQMGVALLRLDYRDDPPNQPPVRQASYLSLVFALREGKWVMLQDQNTPIKDEPATTSQPQP
jgi:hypothetical protein